MPVELGAGAAEALAVPGTGRIVGVYPKAAYLQLPGGLLALTTLEAPPGPLHARAPVDASALHDGDRVVVTPAWLEVGPLLVGLPGATPWYGRLPPADADLSGAADLLPAASVPLDAGLLRRGNLAGLAATLGGRGPGLTPSGDDCLAGILLMACLRWGAVDDSLAASVRTNDIARAYLFWAARGQSIEPVHRFLISAARGDRVAAAAAARDLVAFGHSSGAALAHGLRLGLMLPSAARGPGCAADASGLREARTPACPGPRPGPTPRPS